jgi:hypothetical protein
MNFPTEQLHLNVLTRYKAVATVKDMFFEMNQVYGKLTDDTRLNFFEIGGERCRL